MIENDEGGGGGGVGRRVIKQGDDKFQMWGMMKILVINMLAWDGEKFEIVRDICSGLLMNRITFIFGYETCESFFKKFASFLQFHSGVYILLYDVPCLNVFAPVGKDRDEPFERKIRNLRSSFKHLSRGEAVSTMQYLSQLFRIQIS